MLAPAGCSRHTPLVTRVLIGALKGAAVGGAVGYGAFAAGLSGGWNWLVYGLIGFLIGLLVGRPIWNHLRDKGSTIWTPVLKGLFGVAIATGLYAIAAKAWGTFDVELLGETRRLHDWSFVFGGGLGALYGAFVEADDSPKQVPRASVRKSSDG